MEYEMPPRPHTVGGPLPKARIQSDFILQLLHEIESEAKGPLPKPKAPQKNHMKENLRRLKDIQAQAKQKLAEKQPLQPLKVPNKYCEVQSKVSKSVLPPVERSLRPPKTAGPFRRQAAPSNTEGSLHTYKSLPQLNHRDQVFDEASSAQDLESARSEESACSNAPSLPSTKKKSKSKSEIRHRPGQIPNYLLERRREWDVEREREVKRKEKAAVPEGYTLLPDEERAETLDLLRKNREELIQSLAALPVRNDTIRLRKYKEELERQLAKVEEGIKIFSRPKVLIKHDT